MSELHSPRRTISPKSSSKNSLPGKPQLFVLLHRYVGLVISVFLIVAGLTGSLIAFYWDVDLWVNPELLAAQPPHPHAEELQPLALQERLNEQLPKDQQVTGVVLFREEGINYNYWLDGKEIFVDPFTGKLVGSRTFGDIREGRRNVIGFLYKLHYTLALDVVGTWIFGVVAVLWTFDSFVGAYLTFPPRRRNNQAGLRTGWMSRWAPAWFLKTSKAFSLVFTWHRASGLWLFGFLLVFAWSAVALNLHDEVYAPTMNFVFGEDDALHEHLPVLDPPRKSPTLTIEQAYGAAQSLMTEQAKERGFRVLSERYLSYEEEHGAYAYNVETDRDVSRRLAETTLYLDGATGKFLGLSLPDNSHMGTTITRWIVALHFGQIRVAGLPYRIFVCIFGLLVTLLSVTGIWVWWRKRNKRARSSNRGNFANAAFAGEHLESSAP